MRELVLDIWAGNRGIDLQAWKRKHGMWGVIVKMGGHEYLRENGRLQTSKTFYGDSQRDAHYEKARAIGAHVGAYYYGSATSVQEARQEADHCIDLLKDRFLDLPVYYDVEEREQLDMGDLSGIVRAFCDTIDGAGYRSGIYSGYEGFSKMGDVDRYALWVASWQETWPKWARDFGMWQQGTMRLSDGAVEYDDVYEVDINWCQIDYPSKGKKEDTVGKVLVRVNDKAATIHHAMCEDERNGYSQYPNRWGGDYGSKPTTAKVSTKWWTVEYLLGSYDCSSSTILSWRLALKGTKYEGVLDDATCTSDMLDVFLKSGLFTASLTPAKRGDLYLTPGKHVAMCQDGGNDGVFGADMLSEFNRDENHGAYNGQPGDQDGLESVVKAYYDFPWTTVLHYNGKADYYVEDGEKVPTPAKQKVKAVTRGVYRVYDAGNSRHHWTSDAKEAQKLVDSGWTYEGVAWKSSAKGAKVYRAYNPKTGDHLLCTDAARMLTALGKGWRYEGVSFLAGGSKPVYELYDGPHKEHFYTTDPDERKACLAWMTDKGVAFKV